MTNAVSREALLPTPFFKLRVTRFAASLATLNLPLLKHGQPRVSKSFRATSAMSNLSSELSRELTSSLALPISGRSGRILALMN